jgi:hypothetical protein
METARNVILMETILVVINRSKFVEEVKIIANVMNVSITGQ